MATRTRVPQVPVEFIRSANTTVLVPQVPVELIKVARVGVQVPQAPVEILKRAFVSTQVPQMVVEIINGGRPNPPPPAVTGLSVNCVAEAFVLTGTDFTPTTTVTVTREDTEVTVTVVSITPTQIIFRLPGQILNGASTYCVSVSADGSTPSTLCVRLTCPGCPAVLDPPPPDPPEPFVCPVVSDDIVVFETLVTNPPSSEDIVTLDGEQIIVLAPEP